MGKQDSSFDMERLFRALADRTRLRLLNLMGADEICVCFLVEGLRMSQPKISRHLAYLRRAGVVAARREGKWMHYRLVEPVGETERRVFREGLVKICCAPRLPVPLQGAPRPRRVSA